jgi:hypothetical protein
MTIHFHSPHVEIPTYPHYEENGGTHPPPTDGGQSAGADGQHLPPIHPPSTPGGEGLTAGPHRQPGGGSTPSALPASYALEAIPTDYGTTNSPGVLIDQKGGQKFIVDGGNAYPIRYDSGNQTWRVYQPDKPANPGIPVRRNADGSWSSHGDVGIKGGDPAQVAHERAQLQMQRARVQQDVQQAQASLFEQHLDNAQLGHRQQALAQEIQSMESTGLPPEIWGPQLPQARQELQQVHQQLQQGHQRLQNLQTTNQQLQQQLQQVDGQLQQLG